MLLLKILLMLLVECGGCWDDRWFVWRGVRDVFALALGRLELVDVKKVTVVVSQSAREDNKLGIGQCSPGLSNRIGFDSIFD